MNSGPICARRDRDCTTNAVRSAAGEMIYWVESARLRDCL
jgi:hypothetical protein